MKLAGRERLAKTNDPGTGQRTSDLTSSVIEGGGKRRKREKIVWRREGESDLLQRRPQGGLARLGKNKPWSR